MVLVLVPRRGFAQDLSGTYRVIADQTTVQIPEWGGDCGPRPASHTGNTGREATVTSDGTQLAIQDGRHRNRTDGCWSENPHARRISASHTGTRWSVICQTPDEDYQHEQGSYTIVVDGSRITMREASEYSWQLRESRCRASAARTLTYERTSGANPPPPVVDAGRTPVITPPVAVNRCTTPGLPARLLISPSRRPLGPGGRACFRARFFDAMNCEITAGIPPMTWSMAHTGGPGGASEAVLENGCVRAPSASPVGEYTVTASAGSLTDTAIAAVVSSEELQSLVAQQFEDEDAGAPTLAPTSSASGAGLGGVIAPVPSQPVSTHRTGPILGILIGLGVLLAIAGVALLAIPKKRGSRPRDSEAPERLSDPNARARHETVGMPVKELRPAPAAPALPRPLVKRCPQCDAGFTAEIAFCPEHGTPLVLINLDSVARQAGVTRPAGSTPVSGSICPKCSQPVEPGAQFCPRDATPMIQGSPPVLPLTCPRCQRKFPENTAFCGEDGSVLVRG